MRKMKKKRKKSVTWTLRDIDLLSSLYFLKKKNVCCLPKKKTRQMTLHVHFLLIFETNKSPNESNSELYDG